MDNINDHNLEIGDEDPETLFGDDSDAEKNYNPEEDSDVDSSLGSSERAVSLDLSSLDEAEGTIEDLPENAIPPDPQTSRKRLRRVETWKQVKAKNFRNQGKAYLDRKGKVHDAKKMLEYNHQCR